MDSTNSRPTTWQVSFTVDRRGLPVRKVLEGKNLEKLLAKAEKLDGYNVQTCSSAE